MTEQSKPSGGSLLEQLPTAQLRDELRNLLGALGERAMASVTDRVTAVTGRLTDYTAAKSGAIGDAVKSGTQKVATEAGKAGVSALTGGGVKNVVKGVAGAATQAITGGGDGDGRRPETKVTNIVEEIDVGVPVSVAYNQWTRFTDFPGFMKKVEEVDQESDEKLRWRARILWSHRTWTSTIVEQVPDERIVWRSEGEKGFVDGAVTFHELAPNLTRVVLVLEYHPQGLFERTGNLWRAQGRRVRLELKHFQRHVMTQTILHPDEVEGWRGEIRDSEVVRREEAGESGEPGSARATADEEKSRPGEPERRRRERPGAAETEPRGGEERRPPRARRTGGEEGQRPRRPARRPEGAARPGERRPRSRDTE